MEKRIPDGLVGSGFRPLVDISRPFQVLSQEAAQIIFVRGLIDAAA